MSWLFGNKEEETTPSIGNAYTSSQLSPTPNSVKIGGVENSYNNYTQQKDIFGNETNSLLKQQQQEQMRRQREEDAEQKRARTKRQRVAKIATKQSIWYK